MSRAELSLAVEEGSLLEGAPTGSCLSSSFARAFAEVREERPEVALDLMPVTAAQRAQSRRRVLAEDRTGRGGGGGWRGELVDAIGGGRPLGNQVSWATGMGGGRGRAGLGEDEPLPVASVDVDGWRN